MKPKNIMTEGEIHDYFYKKYNTKLGLVMLFNDGIVVCDPRCDDFSKPGFALMYIFTDNTIEFVKINQITPLIFNDVLGIKDNEVKDIETFLDFVSYINEYCEEYNCDYNTAILGVKENISATSVTNPNQEIIYDEANKQIIFSEGCKSYTLALIEVLKNFIDKKDNFAEFTKESFEFCEENGCSFIDYAKEIALNMLKFRYGLNEDAKKHPQKKLLYTFFDKDGKTAFTYYDNNTINAFKIIDDGKVFYFTMPGSSNLIKNNEEFKAFIKDNRTVIDKIVDKQIKEYEKQKLERIRNANEDFDKSASEVKMNGKPKRTGRGI